MLPKGLLVFFTRFCFEPFQGKAILLDCSKNVSQSTPCLWLGQGPERRRQREEQLLLLPESSSRPWSISRRPLEMEVRYSLCSVPHRSRMCGAKPPAYLCGQHLEEAPVPRAYGQGVACGTSHSGWLLPLLKDPPHFWWRGYQAYV